MIWLKPDSFLATRLSKLPSTGKALLAVVLDLFLSVLALWLAFVLTASPTPQKLADLLIVVSFTTLITPLFFKLGLYNHVLRFTDADGILQILLASGFYGLFFSVAILSIDFEIAPWTIGVIQPAVVSLLIVLSRLIARQLLYGVKKVPGTEGRSRALIYGVGAAGRQLQSIVVRSKQLELVGFVDDNDEMHGRLIHGKRVYKMTDMPWLVSEMLVDTVLLALPSVSRSNRNMIINTLALYDVAIRTVPSLVEIAEGKRLISDVSDLDTDDLLARNPVQPNCELGKSLIKGKKVLISGAGGSIGSQICREVLMYQPSHLYLIEHSEYALYQIEHELNVLMQTGTQPRVPLTSSLCSVQDAQALQRFVARSNPEIIFHAAAFKHVTLVESNVVEGFKNNVLGTLNMVEAARVSGTEKFVLISTDKAVRPTNIMGATKRIAELIVQAYGAQTETKTTFLAVRFGNVLGSSGSVIPKFRAQIAKREPITVTHPEATRFFMTIPEAAQLVIQSCAMSTGGGLFVLDMGQPVKIIDLARRMIRLSGLTERTKKNPAGDIEIKITGLAYGEKIHEELAVSRHLESTSHPKIMKANDPSKKFDEIFSALDGLKKMVMEHNEEELKKRIVSFSNR